MVCEVRWGLQPDHLRTSSCRHFLLGRYVKPVGDCNCLVSCGDCRYTPAPLGRYVKPVGDCNPSIMSLRFSISLVGKVCEARWGLQLCSNSEILRNPADQKRLYSKVNRK